MRPETKSRRDEVTAKLLNKKEVRPGFQRKVFISILIFLEVSGLEPLASALQRQRSTN